LPNEKQCGEEAKFGPYERHDAEQHRQPASWWAGGKCERPNHGRHGKARLEPVQEVIRRHSGARADNQECHRLKRRQVAAPRDEEKP
jgi:hypothetical protein